MEFVAWPKIPRHTGTNVVISEKMDGTNACIVIEDGELIGCQSRKRIITPDDDNFGFARWVEENKDELLDLGDGRHFGEWVGLGIQKNPHDLAGKSFYLFNSGRWSNGRPPCCEVVKVLYAGAISPSTVPEVMGGLMTSAMSENYKPEGIIIYYPSTRTYEKATFENSGGKWAAKNT